MECKILPHSFQYNTQIEKHGIPHVYLPFRHFLPLEKVQILFYCGHIWITHILAGLVGDGWREGVAHYLLLTTYIARIRFVFIFFIWAIIIHYLLTKLGKYSFWHVKFTCMNVFMGLNQTFKFKISFSFLGVVLYFFKFLVINMHLISIKLRRCRLWYSNSNWIKCHGDTCICTLICYIK